MNNCVEMQQIHNRNISVITNFGCRANCWYCVWKNHKLKHVNPPTDWKKLDGFLEKYKSRGKVSLSGGGDCLFKFDDHMEWWSKFLQLVHSKNLLLDIHTREKVDCSKFWEDFFKQNINRVVFSSDHLDVVNNNTDNGCNLTDREYLKWLRNYTQVRITHVVTKNTTLEMIDDYISFTKQFNMQFTVKHLVGYDDCGMYSSIIKMYPDLFHLDDGDYNIYFMPDNTEQTVFLQ